MGAKIKGQCHNVTLDENAQSAISLLFISAIYLSFLIESPLNFADRSILTSRY